MKCEVFEMNVEKQQSGRRKKNTSKLVTNVHLNGTFRGPQNRNAVLSVSKTRNSKHKTAEKIDVRSDLNFAH